MNKQTKLAKILLIGIIVLVSLLAIGLLLLPWLATEGLHTPLYWGIFAALAAFIVVVDCIAIRKVVKDIPGGLFN